MPTNTDARSLGGIAALLIDAHTLYASLLPHLPDSLERDALGALIAVRRALNQRLGDLMGEQGMGVASATPGAVDAACLAIRRHVERNDFVGALRDVEAWDRRLLEAVRRHRDSVGLSRLATEHIAYIVHILEVSPASFTNDASPAQQASAA